MIDELMGSRPSTPEIFLPDISDSHPLAMDQSEKVPAKEEEDGIVIQESDTFDCPSTYEPSTETERCSREESRGSRQTESEARTEWPKKKK